MEKNKIWKGVKIGITVLLLIAVLGTLGGLLYKTLKPVEEVVPPIENKVALGEAVYSKAKIELINADDSKTVVDSIFMDNNSVCNYIVDSDSNMVFRFIISFDEYIDVIDYDLDFSMLFSCKSGVDVQYFSKSTVFNEYVFNNKLSAGLYGYDAFSVPYEYFSNISFMALPRAYVEFAAESADLPYDEFIAQLEDGGQDNIRWMKDLKNNQFYCEFILKTHSNRPLWEFSFDRFVMAGVKSVEVVNE